MTPLLRSEVDDRRTGQDETRGDEPEGDGRRQSLPLARGFQLSIETPHADNVVLRAATGEVVLTIVLTDAGPVLRFTAAGVDIRSPGTVAIDCARLELHAHEHVTIDSRGTLTQRSDGAMVLRSEDDVRVDGERILLNC